MNSVCGLAFVPRSGMIAVMDAGDYLNIARDGLNILINKKRKRAYVQWYAGVRFCQKRGKNKQIKKRRYLARHILPGHSVVDHKDRDTMNNRRLNLRGCSQSQNLANMKKRLGPSTTSKFKGVWRSSAWRWRCAVTVNYKTVYKEYFDSEIEAALAYDKQALLWRGEFASLNFPENK